MCTQEEEAQRSGAGGWGGASSSISLRWAYCARNSDDTSARTSTFETPRAVRDPAAAVACASRADRIGERQHRAGGRGPARDAGEYAPRRRRSAGWRTCASERLPFWDDRHELAGASLPHALCCLRDHADLVRLVSDLAAERRAQHNFHAQDHGLAVWAPSAFQKESKTRTRSRSCCSRWITEKTTSTWCCSAERAETPEQARSRSIAARLPTDTP